MKGSKNGWTLLLLILAGVVLGGFIGSLAAGVSGLDRSYCRLAWWS